jgi:hypothetical protein
MGKMSGGMTLLGVNEMGEFGGIPQEEDWSVVGNDIPVALLGPQLDSKPSWISGKIMGTGLATDSREPNREGAFLSLGTEDIRRGEVVKRIGAHEFTMSTTALCVHNSFWDAFAIEVGEEVNQMAGRLSVEKCDMWSIDRTHKS